MQAIHSMSAQSIAIKKWLMREQIIRKNQVICSSRSLRAVLLINCILLASRINVSQEAKIFANYLFHWSFSDYTLKRHYLMKLSPFGS